MLVLSSAMAILTGFFLIEGLRRIPFSKGVEMSLKGVMAFLLVLVFLAYGMILTLFAGKSFLCFIGILGVLFLLLRYLKSHFKVLHLSLVLGMGILFIFSQPRLFREAGVTPHSALQGFARVIHDDAQGEEFVVGVGSHDLHEKEFQVYFQDKKVIKAAHSWPAWTEIWLKDLMSTHQEDVYCLIMGKDYETFLDEKYGSQLVVLEDGYLIRKRFYLDWGFLSAIIRNDKLKIRDYLKERVLLLKKDV